MKKTFITTLMTFGLMASASAATLQYGLDFNTLGSSGGLTFTNRGVGTTSISKIAANTSTYANYSHSIPVGTTGYSHGVQGATFSISDSNGIDGLDFTVGFSLGIHLTYGNSNWKDAFSMTIDDTTFRVEMNTNNTWVVYGGDNLGFSDGETLMGGTSGEWDHLGLSFQGSTLQVYANGELQKTLTLNTNDNSSMTLIRGCASGRGGDNILVDNLAVYSGVLSAAEFSTLSTSNVPEPTTATLSLLAMAGLAARRRRK